MNAKTGLGLLLLATLCLGTATAQSKDGEVSEALKAKYSPLIDAMKQSMDEKNFEQALKQILSIRNSVEKEKELTPTHPVVIQVNGMVCQVYFELKRFRDAEALLNDLSNRLNKARLQDTPQMYWVDRLASELYQRSGDAAKQKAVDAKIDALLQKHPDWKDEQDSGPQGETEKKYKDQLNAVWQLLNDGQWDAAYRAAQDLTQKVGQDVPPSDPMNLEAWRVLALVEGQRGNQDARLAILLRLKGIIEQALDRPSSAALFALGDLANTYRDQGDEGNADAVLREIDQLIANSPDLKRQWTEEQQKQKDKQVENEKERRAKQDRQQQEQPEQQEDRGVVQDNGSVSLDPNRYHQDIDRAFQEANQHRDDYGKADQILNALLDQLRAEYGEKSAAYAEALYWVWNYYNPDASHSPRDLNALMEQSIALFAAIDDQSPLYVEELQRRGRYYTAEGNDLAKAEQYLRRAESISRSSVPDALPAVLTDQGQLFLAAKKLPEAERSLRLAIDRNAQASPPDEALLGRAQAILGQVLLSQGRSGDAEPMLLQAEALYDKLTKKWNEYHPDYRALYASLVQLYTKAGKKDALRSYQEKLTRVGG